ncbi:MAG TPA: methyltransferase domain-containing protein [Candidatus Udaeobacter sp.]|nr:methyltransferase domain-containing protein [Candidatus Udaeobacter sp.]
MNLFDRRLLRQRRDRAAAGIAAHDFLFREAAERLADRLEDVSLRFPAALDLGCHAGELASVLGGRGGIECLIESDLSLAMVARAAARRGSALVADEEFLPFAPGSFDLVLSCLSLHWTNDLPGALLQIRRALKPDGLFLAVQFGLGTLSELRDCLLEAEAELSGGASLRVSPFADARDGAALLQRAGFALPVADVETLTVTYPDALALMHDLRGMGEANATLARSKRFVGRDLFARAVALYAERHSDAEGRIAARFRLLFLTGWAPHESQQRPQLPGSAARRLADALETVERPAGDGAKPGRR